MTSTALSLALLAALAAPAAAPPSQSGAALVVVGRSGMTPEEAAALVERIAARLKAAGFDITIGPEAAAKRLAAAGISDSASCEGQPSCARDLGAILGVPVIIAVDLGALRKSVAVHLEAIAVSDGKRLSQSDFSVTRPAPGKVPELADFVSSTRETLAARPPPDAPVKDPQPPDAPATDERAGNEAMLLPGDGDQLPGIEQPGPKPTISPAAWATGGLAVAAGATAATFGILGASANGQLNRGTAPDGRPLVGVPEERARQLATTANTDFTVAAIAGVGCAVLSGVTTWLILSR